MSNYSNYNYAYPTAQAVPVPNPGQQQPSQPVSVVAQPHPENYTGPAHLNETGELINIDMFAIVTFSYINYDSF